MKQLLAGMGIGILVTTLVFWATDSNETADQIELVSSATPSPTPSPVSGAWKPAASQATPKSKPGIAVMAPTTPVETVQSKAKSGDIATGARGATSGETKKFVPPLFSGNVEGFPKLDDKTKKTLENAQQKVSMNQPEAAIEELEAALKEDPTNGYYAVELAMMQSDLMKNPRRSEEILADHLQRDPESKMVSAAFADFLSQHGREREATPFFARAASGNAPTEAYAQYGHHLMRMHNPEKAAEAYRNAFEKTQQDMEGKVARGESTLLVTQELGNRAIDLGHAEKQRGNDAEAVRLEQVAARYLSPDDPQLRILRNSNAPKAAQSGKTPSE